MLFVISPTKRFKEEKSERSLLLPKFPKVTEKIVEHVRTMSLEEVMKVFKVKEPLAIETMEKYKNFKIDKKGTCALSAYQGLQYQYMKLDMDEEHWEYANEHIRILDALYGLIHPNTSVYPYRLDMLCNVKIEKENLYHLWKDQVYKELEKQLKKHEDKRIICIASKEYTQMLEPYSDHLVYLEFYIVKNGKRKVESTQAKMARGRMIGFLIDHKISSFEDIKGFKEDGYVFDTLNSNEHHLMFVKGLEDEIRD